MFASRVQQLLHVRVQGQVLPRDRHADREHGGHFTDPAHVERAVQIRAVVILLVHDHAVLDDDEAIPRRELLSNPRRAVDEIRADESVLLGKTRKPRLARRSERIATTERFEPVKIFIREPRAERERQRQRGDDDARAVLGPPRPTALRRPLATIVVHGDRRRRETHATRARV